MSNHNQKQQGDVLFLRVAAIPHNATHVVAYNGRFILAQGEATGHAHCVAEQDGVELFTQAGTLYLVNTVPAVITHEEHHAISLDAGVWEIGKVVEIDPFNAEIGSVRD